METTKIRIGTTGDYAPVSYRNEVSGEFVGTDVELAKRIAAELGLEPVFVGTTWKTMLADLENERFDIAVSGITATDERRQRAYVSVGYKRNGKTLICRSKDINRFRTLADVDRPDVTVVENRGGTNEAFARTRFSQCALLVCEENAEAPRCILAGEADAMITDVIEAEYLSSLYEEIAAPLCDEPFTDDECCVLVGRHCVEFLEKINQILCD